MRSDRTFKLSESKRPSATARSPFKRTLVSNPPAIWLMPVTRRALALTGIKKRSVLLCASPVTVTSSNVVVSNANRFAVAEYATIGPTNAPLSNALPRIFVPLTFDPMTVGRNMRKSSARSLKLPSPRSMNPSASTSTAAERTEPFIFATRSAKVAAMSKLATGDKARLSKPSAIILAGAAVPLTVKVPSRAVSARSAISSDAIRAVRAPSHLRQLPRPFRLA